MDTMPTIPDRIGALERKLARAQQKKAQLEADISEYEADLNALRRVSSRNLLDSEADADTGEAKPEHGEIRRAVEEAIVVLEPHDQFTREDVMLFLSEKFSGKEFDPTSVSTVLRRMAEGSDGKIIEVEKGAGRRMSKYKRREAA
jgi:hypothetical protein